MLAPLLHCTDFFVRFNRSRFYSLFILKHFCPVRKLIWMDKNIFQWRMETSLKDYFIMYYFLEGSWIMNIVNCFCQPVLSTCHNWELFIAHPHRPLCFKKIRTTTPIVFLISSTVVPNYCNHSTAFDPQSFAPFSKFQVSLIDLSQSDIQILYGFQIDNGIRQCIQSSWAEIFKSKFVVHGHYIIFVTLLFISIYKKW